MLRKNMVALAIVFAFALGSAFGGGRTASDGYAYHSERVRNLHRGLLHSHGRGYEWDPWVRRGYGWDPWGHWGAYYGPMI